MKLHVTQSHVLKCSVIGSLRSHIITTFRVLSLAEQNSDAKYIFVDFKCLSRPGKTKSDAG